MLRRVADTLLSTPEIDRVVILAQDPAAALGGDAASLRDERRVRLEAGGAGIASSIAALLDTGRISWPVLITTADHVLLTRAMVSEFVKAAQDCDLAIGFGERRVIEARYPSTRRTWLKFSCGQYSGANLFALRNARVAPALRLWSEVEQDRKKSWKLISRFGLTLLLRTWTRTIDLQLAIERAGAGLRLFAKPVVMREAEAAIDVDKPCDHALAESILLAREADCRR
ncbi:MAG: NTP transferase domain-containing protein [Sphingomonas sp.]